MMINNWTTYRLPEIRSHFMSSLLSLLNLFDTGCSFGMPRNSSAFKFLIDSQEIEANDIKAREISRRIKPTALIFEEMIDLIQDCSLLTITTSFHSLVIIWSREMSLFTKKETTMINNCRMCCVFASATRGIDRTHQTGSVLLGRIPIVTDQWRV